MKKIFSLLAAVLFAGSIMAAESVVYTLTSQSGSNNGYASNCDIEIEGITWNLTGNSQMDPWRIGGKSLSGVDRTLYSKTAITSNVSKIAVEHGTASSITVNSWKLEVASDANFESIISTLTPTFAASQTTEILRPEGADWSNAYYRFTYNVTVTGSSNKYVQFVKAEFYAEEGEAAAVATPVISGNVEFVGTTVVSIACETEGAAIYYTLDGSDPDAEAIAYEGAFTLEASATVKAIAILDEDASAIASKEFSLIPTVTCAEANALAQGTKAALGEVTVAYVNGANIYVKDAAGSTLVYAYDFGLNAGDVVTGLIGKMDPYNGLPEFKPTVTLADLTVTAGEAPAPEELNAAPVAADVNKYIVLKGVSIEGSFTSDSKTSLTATFNEESVTFYNTFKIAYDFEADKSYDIVGAVAIYNSNVQVYFISATEHTSDVPSALPALSGEQKAAKRVLNGQLIIERDGLRYNAQGTLLR